MRYSPYSRKLRQLEFRIRKWARLVFEEADPKLLQKLAAKIRALITQLRSVAPRAVLNSKLAGLLVFGGITQLVSAQNFAPPVENPFGFVVDSTNYVGGICTADLDGDGDLDMLFGGYFGTIDYLENTGTPENPIFSSYQTNPFGLTSAYNYAFITAEDLDGDGDIDILGGQYGGNHIYYQNIGTPTAPFFSVPITNGFGFEAGSYISMPEFADLDNDGDYDVISGEAGGLIYFENQGTPTIPGFASPISNPFGLIPNPVYFSHPTLGDLDGDGDFDMLIGETGGNLRYMQNLANANAPLFDGGQLNPFGIVGGAAPVILPEFVDIDNDGDLDILASGYEGSLWFYENLQINLGVHEGAMEVNIGPNPCKDVLSIHSDVTISTIFVMDIAGKIVFRPEHLTDEIDLSHLVSGAYIIQIELDSGTIFRENIQKQ